METDFDRIINAATTLKKLVTKCLEENTRISKLIQNACHESPESPEKPNAAVGDGTFVTADKSVKQKIYRRFNRQPNFRWEEHLNKLLHKATTENSKLHEANTALKRDCKAQEKKIKDLSHHVERNESRLKIQQSKIDDLKRDVYHKTSEITNLKIQINALKDLISRQQATSRLFQKRQTDSSGDKNSTIRKASSLTLRQKAPGRESNKRQENPPKSLLNRRPSVKTDTESLQNRKKVPTIQKSKEKEESDSVSSLLFQFPSSISINSMESKSFCSTKEDQVEQTLSTKKETSAIGKNIQNSAGRVEKEFYPSVVFGSETSLGIKRCEDIQRQLFRSTPKLEITVPHKKNFMTSGCLSEDIQHQLFIPPSSAPKEQVNIPDKRNSITSECLSKDIQRQLIASTPKERRNIPDIRHSIPPERLSEDTQFQLTSSTAKEKTNVVDKGNSPKSECLPEDVDSGISQVFSTNSLNTEMSGSSLSMTGSQNSNAVGKFGYATPGCMQEDTASDTILDAVSTILFSAVESVSSLVLNENREKIAVSEQKTSGVRSCNVSPACVRNGSNAVGAPEAISHVSGKDKFKAESHLSIKQHRKYDSVPKKKISGAHKIPPLVSGRVQTGKDQPPTAQIVSRASVATSKYKSILGVKQNQIGNPTRKKKVCVDKSSQVSPGCLHVENQICGKVLIPSIYKPKPNKTLMTEFKLSPPKLIEKTFETTKEVQNDSDINSSQSSVITVVSTKEKKSTADVNFKTSQPQGVQKMAAIPLPSSEMVSLNKEMVKNYCRTPNLSRPTSDYWVQKIHLNEMLKDMMFQWDVGKLKITNDTALRRNSNPLTGDNADTFRPNSITYPGESKNKNYRPNAKPLSSQKMLDDKTKHRKAESTESFLSAEDDNKSDDYFEKCFSDFDLTTKRK